MSVKFVKFRILSDSIIKKCTGNGQNTVRKDFIETD